MISVKNQHVWEKMPIEGAIHLQSHSIPLSLPPGELLFERLNLFKFKCDTLTSKTMKFT